MGVVLPAGEVRYAQGQYPEFCILNSLRLESKDAAVMPDLLVTSERSREKMRIHYQLSLSF